MAVSMTGAYNHTVDSKGRIIIPSKLRDALGSTFVMTYGITDGIVNIFPMESWERYVAELDANLHNNKKEQRNIKRIIMSMAETVQVDSQGRTVIPPRLREMAKLDKEIVINGFGDRAEMWPRDRWEALNSADEYSTEKIGKYLENLDIDINI